MSGQIQFKVDTSGVGNYLPDKTTAIIAALMERTTAINSALQAKIAGVVLQGNPIKSHTDKLAGSVRVIETANDGTTISGGVQAGGGPAFYAKFLEDGTQGPYTIQPTDVKGVLAFMIGGRMVFAKKVIHPGLKAFLFMKGTLEESRGTIIEQLRSAAAEASL
jgi:hypothetical protein